MDLCNKEDYLAQIDVSEVWGVGRKISKKLQTMGVNTVLDLASSDPREMQNVLNCDGKNSCRASRDFMY
jgi:DNA polymerase V